MVAGSGVGVLILFVVDVHICYNVFGVALVAF